MKKVSLVDIIPSTITSLLLFSQIISGLYLLSNINQIAILAYIGVGLYVFSGLIFGMLPVFEFRKKGRVKKGKSYIHTTKLVDTGIYSIVRHPQYITFMLWAVAGMFLFQHWVVIILGIPIIPLTYIDLFNALKDPPNSQIVFVNGWINTDETVTIDNCYLLSESISNMC